MAELAQVGAQQSEVVHRLEDAVRPPMPSVPGAELGVYYLPSDPLAPTGGDLYDWQILPNGDLHLVVVDVMGKGLGATKDALAVTHAVRLLVLDDCPLELVAVRADRLTTIQNPNLVATILVARYTPESGLLRLAGAGHPPVMIVSPAGEARQIEAPGVPIGWPGAGSDGVAEIVLDRRDTAVFYTDGLIEAGKDVVAGMAALEHAALETVRYPAVHLARALVERALAGAARRDDTLALVLRRRQPPAESYDHRLGRFEHRFSPIAAAVPVARHLIEDWFRFQPIESDDIADLSIVASELCANAVRAASGRPGSVSLRAWTQGDAVVIEVEDDGESDWMPNPDPDAPEPLAEGGRGLYLVRALMDEITVRHGGGATIVRCVKRALLPELTE
jgi:anti-sigma regulatory factor (Ser/Thr protein kinase)